MVVASSFSSIAIFSIVLGSGLSYTALRDENLELLQWLCELKVRLDSRLRYAKTNNLELQQWIKKL